MPRPTNYLEYAIYEFLYEEHIVPGGDQEKISQVAADLADFIQRTVFIDVNRSVDDKFRDRADSVIEGG